VAKTAAQTAVVLVVLDVLRITRNADWFAEHGAFCVFAWLAVPRAIRSTLACPAAAPPPSIRA
jgi:hypothetical protein